MVEFTIEELMAGKVDVDTINLTDIKAFCTSNGLDEYDVSTDKTKPQMLNEIAELLDQNVGMSVKDYADANEMSVAKVLEITGRTHWKNKLGYDDIAKLTGSDSLEPKTDDEALPGVPTKSQTKAGGYMERRAGQIAAAKARNAVAGDGVPHNLGFIPDQYKGQKNLPGRIQRSIDAQKGGE